MFMRNSFFSTIHYFRRKQYESICSCNSIHCIHSVFGFPKIIQALRRQKQTANTSKQNFAFQLSMPVILIIMTMAALFLRPRNQYESNSLEVCPDDQQIIAADIRAGSYIKIHPDTEFFLDWMPNFHESRFKTSYISYSLDNMREEIRNLPSKSQIVATINLLNNKEMFLIIENQELFEMPGIYRICGKWSEYPMQEYVAPYFYVKSFSVLLNGY